MLSCPLNIKGFSKEELNKYICRQVEKIVPLDEFAADFAMVSHHLDAALEKLAICTEKVKQWPMAEFDPLVSSQHSSFLYMLSNVIWKESADERLPTKLFLVNKALHSIEIFYKIPMPDIFLLGHTVGVVLSNATYGNYFGIFQNSTVGRYGDDRPLIGQGVLMFPNSSIIGRCSVGDKTVLSQGARLVNQDSPGNSTIFPSPSRELVMRPDISGVLENYFRNIEI